MCYWCDSWNPSNINYDGHSFCSTSCREQYKESQKKEKQKRIEEIDIKMRDLQTEKDRLMSELGFNSQKYPWQ